jgi:hypothetical protein
MKMILRNIIPMSSSTEDIYRCSVPRFMRWSMSAQRTHAIIHSNRRTKSLCWAKKGCVYSWNKNYNP